MNCICGFGWFVKDNIDSARIFSFEVIHEDMFAFDRKGWRSSLGNTCRGLSVSLLMRRSRPWAKSWLRL